MFPVYLGTGTDRSIENVPLAVFTRFAVFTFYLGPKTFHKRQYKQ